MHTYYVYIATNSAHTVLYTGVTCNIYRRMFEHETKHDQSSFTAKYNICKLVYVESTAYINNAIAREKQIKGWVRDKKIELINSINPNWNNLIDDY